MDKGDSIHPEGNGAARGDKSALTAAPFYSFIYSFTAEKSSRRFFCQHFSVLSVQTGFSFP
jgi:hypothetical protein